MELPVLGHSKFEIHFYQMPTSYFPSQCLTEFYSGSLVGCTLPLTSVYGVTSMVVIILLLMTFGPILTTATRSPLSYRSFTPPSISSTFMSISPFILKSSSGPLLVLPHIYPSGHIQSCILDMPTRED